MSSKIWWDDGTWAVIEAKDLPPGCPRSKTNDTVGDAVKSTSWNPALTHVPGPGSLNKFVKVRLADLTGAHQYQTPDRVVELKPANFKGRKIPDYPHTCHVCGGKMLVLFSSTEHEGGTCPGAPKKKGRYA